MGGECSEERSLGGKNRQQSLRLAGFTGSADAIRFVVKPPTVWINACALQVSCDKLCRTVRVNQPVSGRTSGSSGIWGAGRCGGGGAEEKHEESDQMSLALLPPFDPKARTG